jgi:transposase
MTTTTRRDFAALEARRRQAFALLDEGLAPAEVARRVGVSRAAVCQWQRRARRATPWQRGRLGRPPKLTARHKEKLRHALVRGAQAHGFLNDLWTLPRVAAVLARLTGVRLHPAHVGRVLGALGWSTQRPAHRALQRDEAAIARWKKSTWPALKKTPGTSGA